MRMFAHNCAWTTPTATPLLSSPKGPTAIRSAPPDIVSIEKHPVRDGDPEADAIMPSSPINQRILKMGLCHGLVRQISGIRNYGVKKFWVKKFGC